MPTSTNLLSAWHVLPARSMVMVPHLPVHQSAPVTMPPRIFVIFSQIVTVRLRVRPLQLAPAVDVHRVGHLLLQRLELGLF